MQNPESLSYEGLLAIAAIYQQQREKALADASAAGGALQAIHALIAHCHPPVTVTLVCEPEAPEAEVTLAPESPGE